MSLKIVTRFLDEPDKKSRDPSTDSILSRADAVPGSGEELHEFVVIERDEWPARIIRECYRKACLSRARALHTGAVHIGYQPEA
jgi:hypothetical protein